MRHKTKTDRLNRFSSYRKATIKSIASSLLIHERIITTKAKAKTARKTVEKIITLGKKGTLFARRRAFSLLCDHKLVKTLFDQIAPKFASRNGGYTRIIPYRYQRGDDAQLVIFELTEKYKEKKPEKKIKETKTQESIEVKKEEPKISKKEKPIQAKAEIKLKEEPPIMEKPAEKEIKEEKEPPKQERPHAHPEEKEYKKAETKKPKGFFKGFKGFFKKERDSL